MHRTGTLANWALALTLIASVGAIVLARISEGRTSRLPALDPKPRPVVQPYADCPVDGDGGDRALNYLKNRVDDSNWLAVPLRDVLSLDRPSHIDRTPRSSWDHATARAVARAEGLPISVEGYLVGMREEGAEATNCHGDGVDARDWHLWLAERPGAHRSSAIVVELTPRVRARHPEWVIDTLEDAMTDSTRVRVSGWLLLDQEHPEQVGKSRATLWEIHPVMHVQLWRGDSWVEW